MGVRQCDYRSLIAEFVWEKEADQRSRATLVYYQKELDLFSRWAQGQEPPLDLLLATEHELRAYRQSVLERRSINGTACAMRAVRAWYNWLVREELIDRSPFRKLRIQQEHKIKAIYSLDDINKLLQEAQHGNHPLRDCLIVTLFCETGIRVSELVGLMLDSFTADRMVVTGKGRKQRELRISPLVMKALRRYIQRERPDVGESALLLDSDGIPLTTDAVKHLMVRLGERAGVPNVHCHRFRHTFLTVMAGAVPNAAILQSLAGHSSISTSVGYINAQHTLDGAGHLSVMRLMEKGK